MLNRGAQALFGVGMWLLAACGAKTLDFSSPDGGTAGGRFSTHVQPHKLPRLDLLFTIDNSSSMADKQMLLTEAIPTFVDFLVDPPCIDPSTGLIIVRAVNGVCRLGVRIFEPIADIHLGIISSSIGNHGATGVCEDAIDISQGRSDPHNDDRGHLLARGISQPNIATFENKGFLYFNPSLSGAAATAAAITAPFRAMVQGVGQHGCGYEAPLEATYRFLVDPEPYESISFEAIPDTLGRAVLKGTDQELLRQRADFLRPDSAVAVVIVTDENDCSIIDGGQNFLPLLPPRTGTGESVLPRGTSACDQNPNDRCCFSCGRAETPAGCSPAATDPSCQKGPLTLAEDNPSIRCFDQKRRYGTDFLYPVSRYIKGFSGGSVLNRAGISVDNPLFNDASCPSCKPRDKTAVIVTGIVGVPWQRLAVDPENLAAGLRTAKQLRDDGSWGLIVGDPQAAGGPVPPADPHMIESIKPREGLPGPSSGPNADPIHGHEWNPSNSTLRRDGDLQFACTFVLSPGRVCTQPDDCDCFDPQSGDMNPLCQRGDGVYVNAQMRAKAYPSTRVLQVLQGLGDQAVTGSICPANLGDKESNSYGYTPVFKALVEKMRGPLNSSCLGSAFPVDTTSGRVPCSIVEVFNDSQCRCAEEPGRIVASDSLLTSEMKEQGNCRCEIKQLIGDVAQLCRTHTERPASVKDQDGWCYVDPAQLAGSCDLVSTCPVESKRSIRFYTANGAPRPQAKTYLSCNAAPIPYPPSCP